MRCSNCHNPYTRCLCGPPTTWNDPSIRSGCASCAALKAENEKLRVAINPDCRGTHVINADLEKLQAENEKQRRIIKILRDSICGIEEALRSVEREGELK